MVKILIGLPIFFVVAVVIAYIEYYRTHKEFLNPGDLFMNVLRGSFVFLKSWIGIPVPVPTRKFADLQYMNVPLDLAMAAHVYARMTMINDGVTLEKSYIKDVFDCKEFADYMVSLMQLYIARNTTALFQGIPIQRFPYTRDKDGKGHVLVNIYIDGKAVFLEPYPEEKYSAPVTLSLKEKGSYVQLTM